MNKYFSDLVEKMTPAQREKRMAEIRKRLKDTEKKKAAVDKAVLELNRDPQNEKLREKCNKLWSKYIHALEESPHPCCI